MLASYVQYHLIGYGSTDPDEAILVVWMLSSKENFKAAILQIALHPSTGNMHPADLCSFDLGRGDASNSWETRLARS